MEKVKKLSIAELKAHQASQNVIVNIDAIKGGTTVEYCHEGRGKEVEIFKDMLRSLSGR